MDSFEGKDMEVVVAPTLEPNEKRLVLLTHDESCFESNDGANVVWIEQGKNHLRPKGMGKSFMVSQFLCQCHGHMEVEVTDDLLERFPSISQPAGTIFQTLKIIKPGKNADGYWGNKDLVDQTKVAIILFEILHTDSICVFAFDNSANHHALAPDALKASRLNKGDGGKNTPFLRDGWFSNDGIVVRQPMQFIDPAGNTLQKGIKRILQERGLWTLPEMKLDEARKLLDAQPDFFSQKEWLEETVHLSGHKIIFYPKFHPEFNWIEMYWGATKRYTRRHCTYSFKDLQEMLPRALKVTTLSTMRRLARRSFRYISAYRSGRVLTPQQIEHAMKQYSSHRSIPLSILETL